jgi:uncharacterized protein YndB with AHSA1/START domain
MGLLDPAAAELVEHREAFEGVGEVRAWIRDLEAARTAELERASVIVPAKGAAAVFEAVFEAAPAVAWDYMTSPARRPQWQHGVIAVVQEAGTPGRRGIGTVNHCIHGKDAIIEEVLDWQPYDHVTYRSLLPIPNVPKLVSTYVFENLGDGRTRVAVRFGMPRSAKDRAIATSLLPMLDEMITDGLANLGPLLAATTAARASLDAAPEPDLPASLGRNAREPIVAAAF